LFDITVPPFVVITVVVTDKDARFSAVLEWMEAVDLYGLFLTIHHYHLNGRSACNA
jgi:hypothetical protein